MKKGSVKLAARMGPEGNFSDMCGVQNGPREGFVQSCQESHPQVEIGTEMDAKRNPMGLSGLTWEDTWEQL